jgi:hypothetical protein
MLKMGDVPSPKRAISPIPNFSIGTVNLVLVAIAWRKSECVIICHNLAFLFVQPLFQLAPISFWTSALLLRFMLVIRWWQRRP